MIRRFARSQIFRFACIGGFASVFYFACAFALNAYVGLSAITSSFLAYAFAAMINYYAHRKFTFNSSNSVSLEMTRFIVATIAGLSLALVIPLIMTNSLPHLVFLTVLIVVPIFSFIMMKFFVFTEPDQL